MKVKLLRLVTLLFFLSLIGLNAATINVPNDQPTIQAAIDAAINGDVIEVEAGTYVGNFTINKEITLQSIDGAALTIIEGVGGTAITVLAENVVIDGFTITNPDGDNGILATSVGFLTISNNIVDEVGSNWTVNKNLAGIYINPTTSDVENVQILSNTIQNIGSTSTGSTKGIYVGHTGSSGSLTNLVIDGNTFDGIFGSTGLDANPNFKGANGIQFNLAGGVSDVEISNNDFNNIDGYWARAIGLEGNTPNVEIYGNTFSNISSQKTYDKYAIFFEDNPSIGTVSINNNTFNSTHGLGIHSNLLATLTSETVDATNNWWGDASGPSGTDLNGTGAAFGTDASDASIVAHVLYSPWLGNEADAPHDSNNNWTFYVDDSNPDAIQEALNMAIDGDIIIADGGTYSAIVINSEITLQGTNGAIINNGSPAITVSADNVTIDGFTFAFNTTDYAIYLDGDYTGVVVQNCTFNNFDGGGVNPGFGIDNETNNTLFNFVDATENNDWNGNGFPFNATTSPTGTGVTISQYVQYSDIVLVSPVNSLSGVSIKPEFTWELTGADGYRVQIATSSDFVNDLLVEHSVSGGEDSYKFTGYFHPEIPLNNNTQYYWRVIAEYGVTDVASSPYYFTTVANVNISLWNPGDNMELYLYDPATFTWSINQAQGSLKFFLQIIEQPLAPDYVQWASFEITAAQGANPVLWFDNINDLYRAVNSLDGGSKFYWRVCAYYDDGSASNVFDFDDRVVKYSSVFSFTTKGGAVKAYPSWPIGGPIYYLDPTFYWYTMQWEPGAHFTVMYSTDNTVVGDSLVNGVTEVYAGTNTYVYIGTDLDPSTTYYWQVRTRYGNEYNYSSVAEFTTYDAPGLVPTAANPSYPTGGLEIYTTAPTFYWWIGAMNVDVNYEVEVSTDNTFGTIDFTFGPTTDLYVQGSGLLPGEYYYWRIKASKIGYPDVYSATAEFSVTGGLNSYPVANWPVGNPTVYTNTPTLSWYFEGSTLGWFHYKVVWSKKDKTPAEWLTQVLANDSIYVTSDMNETFYTFTSPLEYGETYYWAVAAHDHPGGPYSDFAEGSFTIAGNNASIVQTNPANNTIVLTKSPSFYWYVTGSMLGVTHFRVTYSNTELFNANVETLVTTSTSASVNGPLTEGATYWWYVELSYDNQVTWENPSSTWKFTVDPGANAVVPMVGSPARGVTISSNSPTLSWFLPAQSQSALSYEVEVSNSSDFSNATKYENLEQLNAKVNELSDGEYFWRVRSKTDGSTSAYSSAGNFKIGSVTSVEDTEELPLTYNIDQNYPNPFNPTTMINYSLPEANHVTIKIYDMLGQEVRTLLSQEVKAGRHSVEWKGDNNYGSKVSSGTYIYRISAGEYMQAKKMILLK